MDEIYGWFFDKRCGLWNHPGPDGRNCPLLKSQTDNYRQIPRDSAVYYPESIYGNPSSSVIFLGINPGQSAIDPNETEEQRLAGLQNEGAELTSCPNSILNYKMDSEAYVQRHLQYNVQHPTERIISGATRILQKTWACSRTAALSMLTFMNVAHCKCPTYHFARMEPPQDVFWNQCGVQTLKVLSILKPKAVVCLGDPVQYWVRYVHVTDQPDFYASWKLVGNLDGNWYGRMIPLVNDQTAVRIPLVMSYHTANWGKFNAGIDLIAGLLQAILFKP